MHSNKTVAEQGMQDQMQQLQDCGFQPLGRLVTQGLGTYGRALSADGTAWAELVMPQPGLREGLRQLLKKGVLRGAGCTAQFTTAFNNGDWLVTTTAELPPGPGVEIERLPPQTPLADLALRHMQRLEAGLRRRHPLKALIHADAGEVGAAAQRLLAAAQRLLERRSQVQRPAQPLSVDELRQLGVPERLALMIAGECATAEALM